MEFSGENVGWTKADGSPVPREIDALGDLNNKGGMPTTFVPCGCKSGGKK